MKNHLILKKTPFLFSTYFSSSIGSIVKYIQPLASSMCIQRIDSGVPYDSNIYLVTGDRNMLVDTGSGKGHDRVVAGIRSVLGDARLDMIVLTHCHYDHVGGLGMLMEEFGCPAYAGQYDAPYIRMAERRHILSDVFGGVVSPVEISDLSDGDVIDLGNRSFRVIWTPGHTEGGICLYDEVAGALISGDTLFDNGVGRTDFPGGSMKDLRRSIESLSNIDIRELYPGHGNICENYGPAMMAGIKILVGM